MELVLNLVWFVLAVALLLSLVVSRRGVGPTKAEWLAVLCVVALLFPVISMSDDMIMATAYAETGRQDTLATSYSVGQFMSPAAMLAVAFFGALCEGDTFGCHAGETNVVPPRARSLWSPRVQKRPPPSL